MSYISSNANRWYCALESAYGSIPAISAANRIPAVSMTAQVKRATSRRKDKTGSRTWAGVPQGMRTQTRYDMKTYMRDWADTTAAPPHDALFQATLGGASTIWAGGTPNTGTTGSALVFAGAHGLNPNQAIVSGGEIRFVAAVADANTVILNAPFSTVPVVGVPLGPTASYSPAEALPSFSMFDYWDPSTAVQRVITGAAVDQMSVKLNGDFHEFEFKGQGQDVLDSSSFETNQGGLALFPAEPALSDFSYSPVPGNLGQVWLGVIPNQFLAVSSATVTIKNNADMRANEFGSMLAQGISPGQREVSISLELFGQDDTATEALYQSARRQVPMGVMFQLGQVAGQLMGIYLPNVVPVVPEFDDSETRLKWKFEDTRAQGTANNEIAIAFG